MCDSFLGKKISYVAQDMQGLNVLRNTAKHALVG